VANKKRRLPVHMACSKSKGSHTTVSAIFHVHKSKRKKSSKLDADRISPLYLAIKSLSSYKVICGFQEASVSFILVFLQPHTTRSLPIHIALNTQGVDLRVEGGGLHHHGGALQGGGAHREAGVMPIQLATMHKMPNDIIKALMVTDMPFDLGTLK